MAQQYTNLNMHIACRNTAVPSVYIPCYKIFVVIGKVLFKRHARAAAAAKQDLGAVICESRPGPLC